MENPWNIQSIYELQYFNCPACDFKNHSKQQFVNHAYEFHPDSIEFLINIEDNSLSELVLPWNISYPWNDLSTDIEESNVDLDEQEIVQIEPEPWQDNLVEKSNDFFYNKQ